MASILRQVFSNRNILTISSTNMLYQVFNGLWQLWWTLYLLQELNAPVTVVGLLATIQDTSRILFQLPGGILADRIGRKRVIIFGTSLRVIAPVILLTARSWPWVIPGLVLNAVASLYMPAFNAIIAESLPDERRGAAFGAYRMLTSTPQIFMPVVSGYYLDVMGIGRGVRVGLILFTGASVIAAVVRAIFLKETLVRDDVTRNPDERGPSRSGGLWVLFRRLHRTIFAMLVVSIIGGFAMRMVWSFLAPYAYYEIGLSTTQYGLLQTVAMGISVPLYLLSGIIADRFGRVPCILLARSLGPVDSLSLLLLRNYNSLLTVYGVIGVAGGLGGGRIRGGGYMGGPAWQALIADIVPQRHRGKIMGIMGTMTGLVTLPASYMGGYIYGNNPHLLLAVGSTLEALSIPIILLFVREPKKQVS